MNFPFTRQQFFQMFELYNETVWPAQMAMAILALAVFYAVLKPGKRSSWIVSAILAFFWLWMGIVYHWLFFASINPAARFFAFLFVAQGIIVLYEGIIRARLAFSFDKKSKQDIIGLSLMIFGLVIYPLFGYVFERIYPHSPTFGLPCPTTIFTIGTLLLAGKIPKYIYLIPCLWSLIGFSAAISLGVKEDVFLLFAGLIGVRFIFFRRKG